MFKRILVPLDGSELAERALRPALQLAEKFEALVTLLRVIALDDSTAVAAASGPQFLHLRDLREAQDRTECEAYLSAIQAKCQAAPIIVATRVSFGAAPEMIVQVADQAGVDLIVMSTHGRSGLNRFLYGSVAEAVLRGTQLPLLLIPAK